MTGNEITDETLFHQFRAGRKEALGELLERHKRRLYNFALRYTRDPERAADVVQDVFVKIVQQSSSFESKSKFSTWMYSIARNRCIDLARRQKHRRHRSLDAPVGADGEGAPLVEQTASGGAGPSRVSEQQSMGPAIAQAVEALPDDQREVFLLRQVQNMPFKEIALLLAIPENTVKSRMRYALERLRVALAHYADFATELK